MGAVLPYGGVTLWNVDTLQKYINVQPQPKTEFQIISSDTIEDKASALNLSASLKASVLSGLVEVNGSGTYLDSMKGSKQQVRVTLKYSATTVFKSLTMHHLGSQNLSYPDVIEHGTATHVVTSVLYGAQAFFVFDQEVSSTDDIQKIQGQLEAMVTQIPKVALGGGASAEVLKGNKVTSTKINCTFYGDFALPSNPVTYEDAIDIYSTLPKLLGGDGDKAVAVKVWLYPLEVLDPRAAKIAHNITIIVLSDIQTAMEELIDIEMICSDMIKNPVANVFPELKQNIQQFKNLCTQYRQTLQRQLARALPLIRSGKEDEGLLVEILIRKEQSPFSIQNLRNFTDAKQQEMDCVNSYLSMLKDVKIISSETELNQMLLDPKIKNVISFTFTSLKENEPFLSCLKKYLHFPLMLYEDSFDGQINYKQWFQQTELNMKGRQNITIFSEYAESNENNDEIHFIVASVYDKKNPGTSIYLYEEGQLVNKQFRPAKKRSPLDESE
ncbi:neoverrucotoxin subunit alpha-like [Discoglossus pictus]